MFNEFSYILPINRKIITVDYHQSHVVGYTMVKKHETTLNEIQDPVLVKDIMKYTPTFYT